MLQFDKSTLQSLSHPEVQTLSRYYSMVLTPILITEFQTMLAKTPTPKRDWEAILSSLAGKVSSRGAYLVADARSVARANLLGSEIPIDGRIPMPGGVHLRSRDGTYGVYYDEPKEMAVLRDWSDRNFSQYYRAKAHEIRSLHQSVDLNELKKTLHWPYLNIPKTNSASQLSQWIDEKILSSNDEMHIRALSSLIKKEELDLVLTRWRASRKPFKEFAPYAHFFHRVNLLFAFGLSAGVVPTAKDAKAHLDFEYLYYLPFCFAFTSSDKLTLSIANALRRPNQLIIPGEDLKGDLRSINTFLEKNRDYKPDGTGYPPEEIHGPTLNAWKTTMRPRKDLLAAQDVKPTNFSAKDLIRKLDESVFADDPRKRFRDSGEAPLSLLEASKRFCKEVCKLLDEISGDWDEVRAKFDASHVRSIYDRHADLWHPANEIEKQIDEFNQNGRQRILYAGGVEPWDLPQIFRWALYFDQILIPNPFPSPWARKAEFNPLKESKQYELDTLKLCFFVVMIAPLVETEKIVLIPDPMDFDPALRKQWLERTELRSRRGNALDEQLFQRIKLIELYSILRVLARVPPEKRKDAIEMQFGAEFKESFLAVCEGLIKSDPITISRIDFSGDLVIYRSGANLESALFLSHLYDCSILSCELATGSELTRFATTHGQESAPTILTKSTYIAECADPIFAIAIAKTGHPTALSRLLAELGSEEANLLGLPEELFEEHAAESLVFAEMQEEKLGLTKDALRRELDVQIFELEQDLVQNEIDPYRGMIMTPLDVRSRHFVFKVPSSEIPMPPIGPSESLPE